MRGFNCSIFSSHFGGFCSHLETLSLNPVAQCSRRMSMETSGSSPLNLAGEKGGGIFNGAWDVNNRIRAAGASVGVLGVAGMVFDTVYRRVTKTELNEVQKTLEGKIEDLSKSLSEKNHYIGTKIDGLSNALIHTNQRDKISAETENRELRREIERLKMENRLNPARSSQKWWF